MSSCPARLSFQDGEPESLFEPSVLLETLTNLLPRFGQPDNIQNWMNGEDPSGYAIGVMASSIIISSVLALWVVLLLVCSRAGPKRVGWWSGKVYLEGEGPPSAPPILPQPMATAATAASIYSGPPNDSSGQSSLTAKCANLMPPITSDLANERDSSIHNDDLMDSTLPSMSTLQSMFVDDEERTQITPPRDLGSPLPPSPLLPPRTQDKEQDQSQTQEQSELHTNIQAHMVEISALTATDMYPLPSDSSTTSEKYADYLKYLGDAVNPPKLISSPQDDTSMDSEDWLLEDVLADEPTFLMSDLPVPPATPLAVADTLEESPALLRSRPDVLDLSFPDGGEEGFLFDDDETKTIEPNTIESSSVEPETPTSLPHSNFASHAASRKRLLESFVKNRKQSVLINSSSLLVTDDSIMFADVENALLIRPEPVAKIYDDDDEGTVEADDQIESDEAADSSKEGSIHDLVDDLLAHALAPSVDESDIGQPPVKGYDLDVTSFGDTDSELFEIAENVHQDNPRKASQRETRETNSTPPTERSISSHDDEVCLNQSASSSSQEEAILLHEYTKANVTWLKQRRQALQCLNRLRGGVVLAATILVIGTLLGALNGVWALDWNRRAMLNSWSDIEYKAYELKQFVIELRTLQSSMRQQLWNIWQLLDQHCPLVKTSLCPLAYLPTAKNVTCDVTGVPLEAAWRSWLQIFGSPETVEQTLFQPEDWNAFTMDLDTLLDQPVERGLDGWNWALWASVACNCLLSIFALSILAAISLDDATRLHFQLSTWSFATMYWITVVLAWIFGVCFLVGTTLTVDSCTSSMEDGIGAPATTAKILLKRIDTRSFLPIYWDYVVDGCPSNLYPEFLSDRVWTWGNLVPSTVRIATRLEEFSDEDFTETCGSPIGPLRSAAETFSLQLCMVTQSLINIRRNLGCDQWYPLYESMANESTCYQGSTAFVWSR